MNRRILIAVGLLALAGCGSPRDALTREAVAATNEAADALAEVTDQETADAARPKLKEIGERLRRAKERIEGLGKPSEDQAAALKRRHDDAMKEALGKLYKESLRVAQLPGGPDLLKEIAP
jgi:hypothetical protein